MTRDDPVGPSASGPIAGDDTTDPQEVEAVADGAERDGGARRFGGRRFVVALYALLVAFAGVAGVLFARVVGTPESPALFFLVELPPTALGFAVYGAVTIAVVLGVPLALVVLVSERVDDPHAVERSSDSE